MTIDYLYRKPEFPIICSIGNVLVMARSEVEFQHRIGKVDLMPNMRYWRSRKNPLGFSHGMKGQYLLPICAQAGFSLEKPIELAEAQDVYAWVSHSMVDSIGADWQFHTSKLYIVPSLKRKWSKKRIIQAYNDSKNCKSIGPYSEKSLSSKRFETVFSDIVELIEQSQ